MKAFGVFAGFFALFYFTNCVLSLLLCIAIKWVVIGQRTQGKHSWDEDNYCQRWQIYLCCEQLRRGVGFGGRGILEYFCGSAFIVSYFRALGATIGDKVCLYPNGGDPMMTEPDLVEIGDGCAIDDASLICHLNTKGEFSLNKLVLGPYATMRSFSRLLSGATMEAKSRMLEHTLIFSGEVVQAGSTWQGWPAECVAWTLLDDAEYASYSTMSSLTATMSNYKSRAGTAVAQKKLAGRSVESLAREAMMYNYGELPSQNRIPSPIYEDVDGAIGAATQSGHNTMPHTTTSGGAASASASAGSKIASRTNSGTSEKSFEDNVFLPSPDGQSIRMASVRRMNPAYLGTNSTDGMQTVGSASSSAGARAAGKTRRKSNPGPVKGLTVGPAGLGQSTAIGMRGSESSAASSMRSEYSESFADGVDALARKVQQWEGEVLPGVAGSKHMSGRPPASLPQTPNSAFGVEANFEQSLGNGGQLIPEEVYAGAGVLETNVDTAKHKTTV